MGEQTSQTYDLTVQSINTFSEIEEDKPEIPGGFRPYIQPPRTVSFQKNVPNNNGDPIAVHLFSDDFPDAKPGDKFTVVLTKQTAQ